jgi:hypothetical protein
MAAAAAASSAREKLPKPSSEPTPKNRAIRSSAVALSNRTPGCGVRDPAELIDQRPDLRIVKHVLGQDQFARFDPRDVGQQPGRAAFADMERAGGNVDPGKPELRLARPLTRARPSGNSTAKDRAAFLRSRCRA